MRATITAIANQKGDVYKRQQCFLTAAVHNIKRLVASFYRAFQAFLSFYPCVCA